MGLLRVTSRAARSRTYRKDPSAFAMSAAFKFTSKFVRITTPLTDGLVTCLSVYAVVSLICLKMRYCAGLIPTT